MPTFWRSNFENTSLGTAINRFVDRYFSICRQTDYFDEFYTDLLYKLRNLRDPSKFTIIKHFVFETDAIQKAFTCSEYADCYSFVQDKIKIRNNVLIDIFRTAFHPFAQSLSLLYKVIEEDISKGNVNALLPFGEISEFAYIQSLLENTFPSCRLITTEYSPKDCILIGALMYGHSADVSCTSSTVSKQETLGDGIFIRAHRKSSVQIPARDTYRKHIKTKCFGRRFWKLK
ncbi:unnamed protein product [Mytilus edulis]|uniref:Uncharacterized protein n=1 Tax=Mytilus edulis TaxID=6550 RepID=A0A8S3QX92_MYTED|nr:unnamed protein product [Mytilus edulis]